MPPNPEAILVYIQEKGPSVTNQIRQDLGLQDNFVVGALVSEMVKQGRLAITHLSYGTSKFYYDPSRPEKLEEVAKHLNEKDHRAYQLLKTEKVLRHSEQTPLNRVALASIRDYSRPLPVKTPEGEELFWRYYLVPEEEALDLLVRRFYPNLHPERGLQQSGSGKQTKAATESTEPAKTSTPLGVEAAEDATATREALPNGTATTEEKKEPARSRRTKPRTKKSAPGASDFSKKLALYFTEREIVMEEDLGSTKNELSALVRVPSAIGDVRYFCKAKMKKLTNEGDLAAAYLEAQHRGLPLLFLAGGKLTKKAQEVLPTLKGASVVLPWAEEK